MKGLFRPHYVSWSEQQQIEFQRPDYLKNVVRIITETGLRVYKELTPMKKEQVDLENALVWIPDSKTPNGIAEVPLTRIAVDAFRDQMRACRHRTVPVSRATRIRIGHQTTFKTVWHATLQRAKVSVLSDLRSALDIRDAFERRRRSGRMGHPVATAGRCEGVQEVLADEAADETRGAGEAEPAGQREPAGFWHSEGELMGFWDSFGTVSSQIFGLLGSTCLSKVF